MPKKVVVMGGGVAGMSAAHELVERGFTVEIFERSRVPGGKARSVPFTPTCTATGSVRGVPRAVVSDQRGVFDPRKA